MAVKGTAYFADGRPRLQTSYCLFIDILGFAQRIQSAFEAGRGGEALEIYYESVAKKIRELIVPGPDDDNPITPRAWDAKVFTDNVVLGYALWSDHGQNEFGNAVLQAADYQLQLALSGVFCRGGMAIGDLFMDEFTAFGPAMIDAYRLESQVADFPRIVLSNEVVALAQKYTKFYLEPAYSPENSNVLIDVDGVAFINYLDELCGVDDGGYFLYADSLASHRDNIMRQLVDNRKTPKIWAKYRWVASYHNWYCDQVSMYRGYHGDLQISADCVHTSPTQLVPIPD